MICFSRSIDIFFLSAINLIDFFTMFIFTDLIEYKAEELSIHHKFRQTNQLFE